MVPPKLLPLQRLFAGHARDTDLLDQPILGAKLCVLECDSACIALSVSSDDGRRVVEPGWKRCPSLPVSVYVF